MSAPATYESMESLIAKGLYLHPSAILSINNGSRVFCPLEWRYCLARWSASGLFRTLSGMFLAPSTAIRDVTITLHREGRSSWNCSKWVGKSRNKVSRLSTKSRTCFDDKFCFACSKFANCSPNNSDNWEQRTSFKSVILPGASSNWRPSLVNLSCLRDTNITASNFTIEETAQ